MVNIQTESLKVSKETKVKLKSLKRKGEDYGELIERITDEYIQENEIEITNCDKIEEQKTEEIPA